MNIPDRVNDFLVDVRNHGGFANDKNFDRVAAEVFKRQIKELIEECAKIVEKGSKPRKGLTDHAFRRSQRHPPLCTCGLQKEAHPTHRLKSRKQIAAEIRDLDS